MPDGTPRLLLIDDDRKLAALVLEYLEPQGFSVDTADDGPGGLERALADPPDLVILDLMLPGLDGLEVCRRLRARSAVPILMLTARGDETDRIVGLELGADDYLPKPFNPRELLARIRAILRRVTVVPGGDGDGWVDVDGLRLDPGARRVVLDGRDVELTTSEFDLLLALALAAGRVLSRDQLLQEVHGPGWAAYSRSVDVHISRLRQKIEVDAKKPRRLKTIRGAGYQLCRNPGE
ncbi:MAG: response regulator transcription factor [Acidobacteriota bacterium]